MFDTSKMSSKNSLLNFIAYGSATVVVVFTLSYFIHKPILRWCAQTLIEENYKSEKNYYDAIVVLMGGIEDRSQRTFELYEALGPLKIVILESESKYIHRSLGILNEGALHQRYLYSKGIPSSDILYFESPPTGRNHSTRMEADNFFELWKDNKIIGKNFLLVTSWFHTSRALWIFRSKGKTNPGLNFDIAATKSPFIDEWWKHERTFFTVLNEYLKWLHNMLINPSNKG